ncbi:MAG TPA: hypothetical protein VFE15_03505 [Marmoricola sp.]|jgi:hypothetical protein|nr:hypothetical protein [Marmoricola sp.]
MEILLWLVPAGVVTCLAMLWAGWVGRERPERGRSDADQERFANAILRPLPAPKGVAARPRPRQRQVSNGVAVRRSSTRRSA